MVLLGYAVFVFTAESYNPFVIPAKNSSKIEKRRRYHLLGILAGCLVALSCLAAWILSSGNFLEGLKVSFIVATILLLLVLAADTLLNVFRKRQVGAPHVTAQQVTGQSVTGQSVYGEDIENTKTINELESSIALMQKETDALTEKAIRLDATEAELKSVRYELTALKEREQASISLSQSTIKELRSENQRLQNEAERAEELKLQLDNNRLEISKLKSENERHAELRTALEQRDRELQKKLQQAALKERAGRLKMEASAKRALGIARQAVTKLNEHEKKFAK